MKFVFINLLICIAFVSCTSQQESSIPLFNGIYFNLNNGEKVVKIDSRKQDIYSSYFDKNTVSPPLFRCINSNGSLIYIAIPYNTSLKKLADYSLVNTLNQTSFKGDSTSYFYKTYNNDKEQVAIYARNFSNNLVYVFTISNSIESSDSLFTIKAISNRFIN